MLNLVNLRPLKYPTAFRIVHFKIIIFFIKVTKAFFLQVSVIAAFGPLNANKEANAHSMSDKTIDDFRIDFSDFEDHDCSISLYDIPEDNGLKPWPPAKLIGKSENLRFTPKIFSTAQSISD